MKVQIRLFALAKDLAGADKLILELPAESSIRELRQRLGEAHPQLAVLLDRSALAVNDEFAADDMVIAEGVEIALLPPVSGG